MSRVARVVMDRVKREKRKMLTKKRGLMRRYLTWRNDSVRGCLSRSLCSRCTILLCRAISPCVRHVCLLNGSKSNMINKLVDVRSWVTII